MTDPLNIGSSDEGGEATPRTVVDIPVAGTTIFAAWGEAVANYLNLMERKPWPYAWTADTTNPVLGNGVWQGWYVVVGDWCLCGGKLYFGSTTTFGSGNMKFGVPVTAESGSPGIGSVSMVTRPSNALRVLHPRWSTADTFTLYLEGGTAPINAATPSIFASLGDISFSLAYPINR